MDLLKRPIPIDLYDHKWRIYARNPGFPPHYVAAGAIIENSLITEGCEVYGTVRNSVLFAGVTVEQGAEVIDSVVMPGAVIRRGALVRRAIIAETAEIKAGAKIGGEEGNIAVIAQGAVIPSGVVIEAGQQVDAAAAEKLK